MRKPEYGTTLTNVAFFFKGFFFENNMENGAFAVLEEMLLFP